MEKAKAGVAHCVTIREDVLGLCTGGTYAVVKLELPRTIGDENMNKVQEALRVFVQVLQDVAEQREAEMLNQKDATDTDHKAERPASRSAE